MRSSRGEGSSARADWGRSARARIRMRGRNNRTWLLGIVADAASVGSTLIDHNSDAGSVGNGRSHQLFNRLAFRQDRQRAIGLIVKVMLVIDPQYVIHRRED